MKKRGKLNLTIQYVLIFGALLLAANILLGLLLLDQSRSTLRANLHKSMLDVTSTAAGFMDGDKLGALTEADVDGPYFNEVIGILSVFQERVDVEFIYAVRQVGEDEFVFTVDPDPVDPGAFGEEVVCTDALRSAGAGIASVDVAPMADRWGNFYSAYCPVFDSGGDVAGIIGVDFDAAWYEEQIQALSRTIILVSTATVLLGAAVIMLITNRTRKRFRDMSDELSVLSEDVDELTGVILSTPGYEASMAQLPTASRPDLTASPGDEIGALSDRINAIQTSMKTYLDYVHTQANTDGLTGVGNTNAYLARTAVLDELGEAACYAVAVFDLDLLKEINDELGHACGDMVIRGAATVICRVFGKENVYRIGGDEFIAIAEQKREADMPALLHRVENAAGQFTMPDRRCDGRLSLSSGAVEFRPGTDKNFQQVFVRADEAMYQNKQARHIRGRNHDR